MLFKTLAIVEFCVELFHIDRSDNNFDSIFYVNHSKVSCNTHPALIRTSTGVLELVAKQRFDSMFMSPPADIDNLFVHSGKLYFQHIK